MDVITEKPIVEVSPFGGQAEAGPSRKRSDNDTIREINSLISRESSKTKLRRIAAQDESNQKPFNPICTETTLEACKAIRDDCEKAHYEPIIRPWTDVSLGYCSYLNLCYGDPMFANNPSLGEGNGPRGGVRECRYMHFQVVPSTKKSTSKISHREKLPTLPVTVKRRLLDEVEENGEIGKPERYVPPPVAQWINCDIRSFYYSLLGQFQVIVADPPWDIHMSLPYGTMTDDEMRSLPLRSLQPDWGILCLWVTGRAMELGRELFAAWGYKRVDELVWVKTNQLQRLIRTGRTGHWLNHTCEHLLIALKLPADHPKNAPIPWDTHPSLRQLRKGVDTDVVVAEVRETSRKPDEVYGVIERLAPHGRKLELFGRKHNTRPGWLTLGNQLGDSQVAEEDLHDRLSQKYPAQRFVFVSI